MESVFQLLDERIAGMLLSKNIKEPTEPQIKATCSPHSTDRTWKDRICVATDFSQLFKASISQQKEWR